jgi:hypothetical protein
VNEDVTRDRLAVDVLSMAVVGGMPGSYWYTDRRVLRACEVLGVTPEEALSRQEEWVEWSKR